MPRTYTEAQYSTPSAMQMIRDKFLPRNPDLSDIERAAKYMSQVLRIGGIKACRALVVGAIVDGQSGPPKSTEVIWDKVVGS